MDTKYGRNCGNCSVLLKCLVVPAQSKQTALNITSIHATETASSEYVGPSRRGRNAELPADVRELVLEGTRKVSALAPTRLD